MPRRSAFRASPGIVSILCVSAVLLAPAGGCRKDRLPPGPCVRAEFPLPDDFPIEIPVRFKGDTYRFVFDTGCGVTSFSHAHKDRMGPLLSSDEATGSLKQSVALDYHAVEDNAEFKLGAINITGRVGLSDYAQFGEWMTEYDGLLGMDVLEHFVVRMDFAAGTLRILDPGLGDPCDWGHRFDLDFSGGTPHLRAELPGGLSESFMIDTAAPRCYLQQDRFAELLAHLRPRARYTPREITVETESLKGVQLDDWRLGPMVYEDMVIIEYPRSFLGLSFLRKHAVVTFDFPNAAVYLQPFDAPPPPDHSMSDRTP